MRNSTNLGGDFNLNGLAETQREVKVKGENEMLILGGNPILLQIIWVVLQTPWDLCFKEKMSHSLVGGQEDMLLKSPVMGSTADGCPMCRSTPVFMSRPHHPWDAPHQWLSIVQAHFCRTQNCSCGRFWFKNSHWPSQIPNFRMHSSLRLISSFLPSLLLQVWDLHASWRLSLPPTFSLFLHRCILP